jgi:hypothetical protein
MNLVERYIAAVKFWLPAKLKDDIAAELAEDIRSQIEEAEARSGRPLTEDEVAALLKARGNPLLVASRYLPQHTLIGPQLYPVYIFVLKIVAAISLAPPFIALLVAIIHGDTVPLNRLANPFDSLLMSFATVTIIFALIERSGINPAKSSNWNPKSLPPVVDRSRIKRATSVSEIAASLIVIGFFLAGYLTHTVYDFPDAHIAVSPQWIPYWQIIAVVAVAEIALAAANLLNPYWSVLRTFLRMAVDLVKTAAFCWLLQSHVLREFAIRGAADRSTDGFFRLSDLAAEFALPIGGLVAAGIVIAAIVRITRRSNHAAA